MQNTAGKPNARFARLLLRALMAAMYLLLVFEVFSPHGAFGILAAYCLGIFVGILGVSFLLKDTFVNRLNWISWGFVGLLLNWIVGFLCVPL